MSLESLIEHLLDPTSILLISLVVLLIERYVFKVTYINCFDLIKKHIQCFEKRNGKISIGAIISYFLVPFLLTVGVIQIRIIDDSAINIITVIISILTAMFFTLLTLILDMRQKVKNDKHYDASDAAISSKVLKETYYSIMFEILVSVAILIMCFCTLFTKKFSIAGSFIIYYLTFIMIFNLFMILKRIFKVIDRDLNN